MPRVVNVRVGNLRPLYANLAEWIADEQNVYVGRKGVVFINGRRYPQRDSPWANPYKVDTHGSRNIVLRRYKTYILRRLALGELNIEDLRGKNLGCWCSPEPCHADLLLELANTPRD